MKHWLFNIYIYIYIYIHIATVGDVNIPINNLWCPLARCGSVASRALATCASHVWWKQSLAHMWCIYYIIIYIYTWVCLKMRCPFCHENYPKILRYCSKQKGHLILRHHNICIYNMQYYIYIERDRYMIILCVYIYIYISCIDIIYVFPDYTVHACMHAYIHSFIHTYMCMYIYIYTFYV